MNLIGSPQDDTLQAIASLLRPDSSNGPRSGPDGKLDLAAAGFHALKGLRQVRQADFFGDKVMRGNVSTTNGFERFAEKARRVMKRGDELDFRVVEGSRLDFDVRARRQAAKEIDGSSPAHHGESHVPRGGITGCFDDGIRAALIFGESAHGGYDVGDLGNVDSGDGPEPRGQIERRSAPSEGDDANATAPKHPHKSEADGTTADDDCGIADANFHFVDAAENASEWLG